MGHVRLCALRREVGTTVTAAVPAGDPGARCYDREALITAIDELHEATFEVFRPEARRLAAALGWTDDTVEPDSDWLCARLDEVLR